MVHEDAGHYAAKHPGANIDKAISDAIAAKEKEGRITCAAAHAIAKKQACSPQVVGMNIDLLEKRIRRCQLGLFGYGLKKKKAVKPAAMVTKTLRTAIRKAMDGDSITCQAAWTLAKEMSLTRLEVSSACEALKIKISKCQLGAF
ncbi:hypothetical protein [uncultured Desulfosarcina sp.]|uniref:hypothetical protein n=1 Tax=uncultured Desulfosarcina sp. TaxID=218289 RepID=UPI0029C97F78|nr:hypothetical protein [uncultured Desulfosarcina sp.]